MTANKSLKVFGEKVKEYRLKQNLTQEELADMVNLHRTYISLIERGLKNITLLNILKITKALKINVSNLLEDISKND